MTRPFINSQETIDRIVGKRTHQTEGLTTAGSRRADSIASRRSFGGVRVPRGVHRFTSHEEADRWLWRMIARPTD